MNKLENAEHNSAVSVTSDICSPLLTIEQFHLKHGWPKRGLRHLIFHQPEGFQKAIRRVGRKVLIHEQRFFDWVEEINSKKNATCTRHKGEGAL